MRRFFLCIMISLSVGMAFGQDVDFTKYAGFIDFGRYFNIDPAMIQTEVEIKNPLLSLVARAAKNEDEELSTLLDKLQLIKVYILANTSNPATVKDQIGTLDKKMTAEKWDRFVRVQNNKDNEVTNIYMKYDKNRIVGLTVLAVDNKETTLINIIGDIDMSSIGKLSQQFNIPKLDTIKTK